MAKTTPTPIHDPMLEVEEELCPLRLTAAMLDVLNDSTPDLMTFEELSAWHDLTQFGITQSVAQLHRSIDRLLDIVAAKTTKEIDL